MTTGADMAVHLPEVIFGWSPIVVSTIIFFAVYAVIISDRINQAVIALLGACAMILLGVLNQEMAVAGIDFNTIFLLIGMMVLVGITKKSGIFEFTAIISAKTVRANPRALLAVLSIITAVFSALLDNVTTVMLIVPITLLLTEQLKLNAFPFLFSQIFASNVGGMATLIGDPPNILIGSAVGFSFMDFVVNIGPASLIIMAFLLVFFDLVWGRKMQSSNRARAHLLRYNAAEAITDKELLFKSLFVLGLVMAGFILGHPYGIEPGTSALAGAALLMLLDVYKFKPSEQAHKVHEAFIEVEWETIFFFIGLFIIVFGIEQAGVLSMAAESIMGATGTNLDLLGMLILGGSTIVSTVVNNIPFVATMIPLIEASAADLGGHDAIEPLWWCLALGACLGGNGSLIGASANVMVASFAERAGQRISFMKFLVLGFPLMLVTTAIGGAYIWVVHFV